MRSSRRRPWAPPSFADVIDGFEAELGPGEALGVTGPRPTTPGYGLEAESLPAEIAEDFYQAFPVPRLGPTPVANVRLLMNLLNLDRLEEWSNIRTFGWVEGGYTGASDRPGHPLGPDPAEPLRRRIPAQPDRLGDPEAAPSRINSTSAS